jgi:hypothetical protein
MADPFGVLLDTDRSGQRQGLTRKKGLRRLRRAVRPASTRSCLDPRSEISYTITDVARRTGFLAPVRQRP